MNRRELTPEEKQTVRTGLEQNLSYITIGKQLGVSGRTVSRWARNMVKNDGLPAELLKHIGQDTRAKHKWNSKESWINNRVAHMEGVRKATETSAQRRQARLFPKNELPQATQQGLDTLFAPRRKPKQ